MNEPNFQVAGTLRVAVESAGVFPYRKAESLSLLRIADEIWKADTGIRSFISRVHTCLYIRSGYCELELAEARLQAGPGLLVILPAGLPRKMWVSPARNLKLTIFDVMGSEIDQFMASHNINAPTCWAVQESAEILQILVSMTRLAAHPDAHSGHLIKLYLRVLLALARPGESPALSNPARDHFGQIRKYIDDASHPVESVAGLARRFGLSPDYLARLFRRFAGESIGQYLRRSLMTRAGLLLTSSERKLDDLATELGYSDAFAFTKAFKSHFGMPPGRWRSQFRQTMGRMQSTGEGKE